MPKEGQYKVLKLSETAQELVKTLAEKGESSEKISLAVYNTTREKVSARAIINFRKGFLDRRVQTLEALRNLKNNIIEYAPKDWEGDDFGWLQRMLNAALKEKTADLLMNGDVPPEELLKYQDAAERRDLERARIELEKIRLETERKKAEADIKNAETRAKEAEYKLQKIKDTVDKTGNKKMTKKDLEEKILEVFGQ
jgi:hypothetical protein